MAKLVSLTCEVCGDTFRRAPYEVRRNTRLGRANLCSRACLATWMNRSPKKLENTQAILADRNAHQFREDNPNWKGGVSAQNGHPLKPLPQRDVKTHQAKEVSMTKVGTKIHRVKQDKTVRITLLLSNAIIDGRVRTDQEVQLSVILDLLAKDPAIGDSLPLVAVRNICRGVGIRLAKPERGSGTKARLTKLEAAQIELQRQVNELAAELARLTQSLGG